ncbi:hypothetical protein D9M69_726450 [compost metagenome]
MARRLTRNSWLPVGYLLKSITISARAAGGTRALFMVNGAGSRLPSVAMRVKFWLVVPFIR